MTERSPGPRDGGRPGVVVGALIRDGGRVLLLHRDGTWTTPDGWVERGET